MNQPLISIVIPAYNHPDYTRKTLQSIAEQTYRPIEIILSDDCSPISLQPVVDEFKIFENEVLMIRFYRQKENLGPYKNATFVFKQATGKYLAFMSHDDWYTDKNFLSETVGLMENTPGCYLCGANSEYEDDPNIKMIHLPVLLTPKDRWHIIAGDRYIKLLGPHSKRCIGYQSYSGMILNLEVFRSLGGGYREPYNIDDRLAKRLGIESDEGFVCQFLLSSVGSVAISEKVVSVRGRPKDSYSQTAEWGKIACQSLFVVYYNLYKANLTGKYATAVKKRAKQSLFEFPVEKMNFKILKYYDYDLAAVFIMSLAYAKRCLLQYPAYYRWVFKKLRSDVKSGKLREVIARKKEQGMRGLFDSLFPFR
jgi:glycosyltransferase involved in cell wall biosynthesis